jgi:predicted  nucleic acid-binding Zn-ribbon protein
VTLAVRRARRKNEGMVRCTKCRFLFEAATPGLLPDCRQCGGATVMVVKIEPADAPPAQPTMKFAVIKTQSAAG